MCTAVSFKTKGFYFGRTLDYEFLYPCEVAFTPRNYLFDFRFVQKQESHNAMLGMAYVMNGYPLYFDAVNEHGLCMAGLNFVGNAVYREPQKGKENVASFEFIPYILGRCGSVAQARLCLNNMNITDTPFTIGLPPSQLHWMIADKNGCITVEAVAEGLKVYSNPVGVLTNNPPFPEQLFNLNKYACLSPKPMENRLSEKLETSQYSRGMGALGLPGDYTSQSRFVRGAFVKLNSHSEDSEEASVTQFFHILNSVSVPEGPCEIQSGEYDKTLYSSCMSADKGIYYYKPYESHGLFAVDMRREDMEGNVLKCYPYLKESKVTLQN
ncbi:MAG: choloylglycine hydrolase [Ruminococcus sp.]|nr:choloylglycine hydrolase [Ruminococcus sp.]